MDNTYFILSNRSLSIERFQICTWKLIGKDAFVELGVEIKSISPLQRKVLTH